MERQEEIVDDIKLPLLCEVRHQQSKRSIDGRVSTTIFHYSQVDPVVFFNRIRRLFLNEDYVEYLPALRWSRHVPYMCVEYLVPI